MIWHNVHMYILYLLVMSLITGLIWTGAWYILKNLLQQKGHIRLIYHSLRLSLIGYMVPFVFAGKVLHLTLADNTDDWSWLANDIIRILGMIVFVIWILGMLAAMCGFFANYYFSKMRCSSKHFATKEENECLERCRKKVRVKRKVKLHYAYNVTTAFTFGFPKAEIYLPECEYTEEELDIVLTHELTHIKNGDLVWKTIFRFYCCFFWFNPYARSLLKEYKKWCEAYCDNCCYVKYYTAGEYFDVLFDVIIKLLDDGKPMAVSRSKEGKEGKQGESELDWRVRMMSIFKEEKRRVGLAGIVAAGLLLVSTVSTYAVEVGTEYIYSALCVGTLADTEWAEEPEGTPIRFDDNGEVIEYEADFSELLKDGEIEILEVVNVQAGNVASPQYASGLINNWVVKPNHMIKSGFMSKTTGQQIAVTVNITPTNKTVQIGIIALDGSAHYIVKQASANYVFTTWADGYYAVFVRNISDTTVTASGGYTLY